MNAFDFAWNKYGLSNAPMKPRCLAHDIVCSFLLNNKEIEYKHLKDESGFRYLDILKMAEKAYNIKVYGDYGEYVEYLGDKS